MFRSPKISPGAHLVSDTPTESIMRVLPLDEQRKRKTEEKAGETDEREEERKGGKGVTAAGVDSILSDFEASSRDLDQAE